MIITKKTRRKFTDQEQAKAVADILRGAKSAEVIVYDLGVNVYVIYQWRAFLEEQKRESHVNGITLQGVSKEVAEHLLQQQEEIEAYEKKVAEQALIIDLLKKLQTSTSFPLGSELSGLITITKKSDRKKEACKVIGLSMSIYYHTPKKKKPNKRKRMQILD